MATLSFEPIGIIHTPFRVRFGTPRQPGLAPSAMAELKLRRDLQPELALQGLETFSHIWLIFLFHQNTNKVFRPKIHPPRLEGKTIGVFATRSPHRANPIGLSLVKLEKIEGDTLFISGVDLVDQTPVLDIKPYIKSVESIPDAVEGWLEQTESRSYGVSFYPGFDNAVCSLSQQGVADLKSLIQQVVQSDPRPRVYRSPQFEGETHALYLESWNVFFQVHDRTIEIVKIEKG